MAKYIAISERGNDNWTKEFDELDKAIAYSKDCWNRLTDSEKKKCKEYVLESVNADEEAPDHFDGDVVWSPETEE